MDYSLFEKFENELFDEAKRLVPIVYDEKDYFFFKLDGDNGYKNHIDKKFKYFSTNIELLLVGLCGLKSEGKDISKEVFDIKGSIEHHKKVLQYDKEEFNANVDETIDKIAKELTNNYEKYEDKSLFEVMPVLVKKYMNSHNDSVEHTAYVLYLNDALKTYGKYLPSTNIADMKDI